MSGNPNKSSSSNIPIWIPPVGGFGSIIGWGPIFGPYMTSLGLQGGAGLVYPPTWPKNFRGQTLKLQWADDFGYCGYFGCTQAGSCKITVAGLGSTTVLPYAYATGSLSWSPAGAPAPYNGCTFNNYSPVWFANPYYGNPLATRLTLEFSVAPSPLPWPQILTPGTYTGAYFWASRYSTHGTVPGANVNAYPFNLLGSLQTGEYLRNQCDDCTKDDDGMPDFSPYYDSSDNSFQPYYDVD